VVLDWSLNIMRVELADADKELDFDCPLRKGEDFSKIKVKETSRERLVEKIVRSAIKVIIAFIYFCNSHTVSNTCLASGQDRSGTVSTATLQ
jgi:hypothetical protein